MDSLHKEILEYAEKRGFETDWNDVEIKEYDEMIYRLQELGDQRRELMSEEELEEEREQMEKEAAYLEDLYKIQEELDEKEK